AVGYLPGYRVPFQPFSLPGLFLPSSKKWNPGFLFFWDWKNFLYRNAELFSVVPFLHGAPAIYTNSMEVAKQVISEESQTAPFSKPASISLGLTFWGPNIISAEQGAWRKYRRVVGPAFNNETYALVWSESLRSYHDMMAAEGWDKKQVVEIYSMQRITSKFALLIISSCGFGLPFTWESPPIESESSVTIQDAIYTTARSLAFVRAPGWAWYLPVPWIQHTRKAFDTMRTFMQNHAQSRREDIRSRKKEHDDWRKDVFNLLAQANDDEGKLSLNDHELVSLRDRCWIGNVFVLLSAGHETTAYTLAATLALLALNPTIQSEVVEHIQEIVGEREPTFQDYAKLDKVLGAFYEGLRMFPAGALVIREARQDTTLVYPRINSSGNEESIFLPVAKGTHILVDMVGVQRNPRYFLDPDVYRPSRWYAKNKNRSAPEDGGKPITRPTLHDSEEFTAFSVGPRACIGRKFATTEAVCLLTLLLRDWQVEPLLRTDETIEEWRERVMQVTMTQTAMGIKDVPLRFIKR
ncbi:hypothetical protein SERLA73DRAFT_54040, partial [Serpula lacrymans var. lacrymans S7.3]